MYEPEMKNVYDNGDKKKKCEMILKSKKVMFENNVSNFNVVVLRGRCEDIGNVLNDIINKMADTGNYNSAVKMKKEMINLQNMTIKNIKQAINLNNNNICKFVEKLTRGMASYIRSGFDQLNKKINEDNLNNDAIVNNTFNEINELWKYINENVYKEFKI